MRRGKACSGFSKTTQDGPCATRRKSVAGRAWGIARYTRLFPSCSMRRNSNPVVFPPPVSRCMPSISPPAGASQTSSLTVPWSSPDHAPASQLSWARSSEPGTSAGHSGTAARSSRVSKVIVRSVRISPGTSCAEARAHVLDGSDTEALPESSGVDERHGQRSERCSLLQRAGHPGGSLGQLVLIVVREPEPQELQLPPREVEHLRALEQHAGAPAGLLPAGDVDPIRDSDPEGHAAARNAEGDIAAQAPTERGGQRVAAAGVEPAHPAEMPQKLSILEQLGDGVLDDGVPLHVAGEAEGDQSIHQLSGRHDEAHAEPGSQDLGERPEVQDVRAVRASGDWWHRTPL